MFFFLLRIYKLSYERYFGIFSVISVFPEGAVSWYHLVCSLHDPWPLWWEKRPVQISSLTRPQGVLQFVSGARWNYICLLHSFLFVWLLPWDTEKKKKGEIETNAKQKDRKEVLS